MGGRKTEESTLQQPNSLSVEELQGHVDHYNEQIQRTDLTAVELDELARNYTEVLLQNAEVCKLLGKPSAEVTATAGTSIVSREVYFHQGDTTGTIG